ncbi:MAG: hypothetical protein DYH12_28705, partial [Sorangiineae bacterium PRO1]|nr:hypothetical protein [Sorangiineae bacterium PRO1]
ALRELGDGRWAPWEAVAAFVRADSRTPGLARLLERWAQRAGVEVSTPAEIAQRIACETLHSLGVVDLGDPSDDSERPTLRITPRGRAYITGTALPNPDAQREGSRFVDGQVLRIGPADRIGSVVALSPLIEIGSVTGSLDVSVTQHTLSLALAAGFDADNLKGRLEALAQLPDPIERMLTQASAVLGRAEYVPTQGFLWVEDNEIREMLRTRRQTADLFVDPSPPAGLLLSPGTDIERVARRCRSLGVEVVVDGEVYRTRSLTPPPRNGSAARRYDRTEPPTSNIARKHTGTRRRSSTQTPALKRKP